MAAEIVNAQKPIVALTEEKPKKTKKPKANRAGGGEVWHDPSLDEWGNGITNELVNLCVCYNFDFLYAL